jgi:hypothetical protein
MTLRARRTRHVLLAILPVALLTASLDGPTSTTIPRALAEPVSTGRSVDTTWTPNDVGLLATTGRPQLVEFFHPS